MRKLPSSAYIERERGFPAFSLCIVYIYCVLHLRNEKRAKSELASQGRSVKQDVQRMYSCVYMYCTYARIRRIRTSAHTAHTLFCVLSQKYAPCRILFENIIYILFSCKVIFILFLNKNTQDVVGTLKFSLKLLFHTISIIIIL